MPFIDNIVKYGSCSIVGMAKNCGKTVVLNHILSSLHNRTTQVAVTSIGVDGEKVDSITLTAKPEIILDKGTFFATSEGYYNQRRLISEIIDSTEYWSPLGKIVIGRVLEKGKIIISGPSDTYSTKMLINHFHRIGANLILVDGALSRKTTASPIITDSLILCTGAALSINMEELIRQTTFTHRLISLNLIEENTLKCDLERIETGVWGISGGKELSKVADSVFDLKEKLPDILKRFSRIYLAGMLTSNILESIMANATSVEIVVQDFTKIFTSSPVFNKFTKQGGQIKVLRKAELIAVCINPVSPTGHVLYSEELADRLQQRLEIGVYDVKKIC